MRVPLLFRSAPVLAVIGSLTLAAQAATPVSAAAGPACFAHAPTIVATKDGVTVRGTSRSDVIDALGKNVRVLGLGGNDLICVGAARSVDAGPGDDFVRFTAGTILGGAGNDVLQQSGTGNAAVFGGLGNDRIGLTASAGRSVVLGGPGRDSITGPAAGAADLGGGPGSDSIRVRAPGARVDGGADPDSYLIPAGLLARTKVVYGSGDLLNGQQTRIDAPVGRPSFTPTFDFSTGRLLTSLQTPNSLNPYNSNRFSFAGALAPNGATIAAWSVDFGDGSPVLSGVGGAPTDVPHDFLTAGRRIITARLVDSAGGVTTKTMVVDLAGVSEVAITTASAATDATKTFKVTETPGVRAQITRWSVLFGDGGAASGTGAPPATLTHTYATPGNYYAQIAAVDDHGGDPSNSVAANYLPAAVTGGFLSYELSKRVNILNPSTPFNQSLTVGGAAAHTIEAAGQELLLNASSSFGTAGYGNPTIQVNWGDGSTDVAGPSDSKYFAHSYRGPGSRTVTVVARFATGPAQVSQTHVTVTSDQIQASLSSRSVVPEGLVGFSTAGTSAAAGVATSWTLYWGDGTPPVRGSGLPPARLSHVYPSGTYYPELSLYDARGAGFYSAPVLTVTSPAARVVYFAGSTADTGSTGWLGGTTATDSGDAGAVAFSGAIAAATGSQLTTGTLSFGDGTTTKLTGLGGGTFGNGGGRSQFPGAFSVFPGAGVAPNQLSHAYARPGEYLATVRATDTGGHSTIGYLHVSIAGRPQATLSGTATATVGMPFTLPLSAVGAGTRGKLLGYNIVWGDGEISFGYGRPGVKKHTYFTPGTYTVVVTLFNDHDGSSKLVTIVTVT